MIFKNLCVFVLWTEIALALEGLSMNGLKGVIPDLGRANELLVIGYVPVSSLSFLSARCERTTEAGEREAVYAIL